MIVTVDTGGTKTLVAVFAADGTIASQERFPTPRDTKAYLTELQATIDRLLDGQKPTTLSVALPGPMEGTTVKWCPNLGWQNFDIVSPLTRAYGIPVYVQNDANLAGLAEARSLDPVPPLVLYVTFSTGIGTAIIADGKLLPALSRSEGGHAIVEFEGSVEDWENVGSGTAIVRTYGKMAREIEDDDTWQEIAWRMASGLLAHIPLLQPDVVVIGGGVGSHFRRFHHHLTYILDEQLPPFLARPRLVQAVHPEEAVIYGCYYYAIDQAAAA